MTESIRKPEAAALQFMTLDFLTEILKFSANPTEMAQHLVRLWRELMGVRTVVMVQHDPDCSDESARIVAIEPRRALRPGLLQDLLRLLRSRASDPNSTVLMSSSTTPGIAEAMDQMEITHLSLGPLCIGEQRVGTLFSLSYLDQEHMGESGALLDALAPVFAMILRTTVHYQAQEDRVIAQAEDYRTLLKVNLDGYWAISGQGAILDANDAYLGMSGYSLDEIKSLHITHLDAVESAQTTLARIAKVKQVGSDRFQSLHRRKDGSTFPVEISTTYIPGRDGFIAFIRDLTALKKAEAETATLQAQLLQSQKMESLGILASGVAHDINNVLAAILGASSVLQAEVSPSSRMAVTSERITKACLRGRDVVRSLLLFARQDLVGEGPVDLNQLVGETIELLAHSTLKRVALKTELLPDLPKVSGDRSALSTALINLCVNAVDAMPEGGTLTIHTRRERDGAVTLLVQDTGMGMTDEVRLKALDPFFTTKPAGKGTGLGLPMVYGTMQSHDGTVILRSKVGEGTSVELCFPATRILPSSGPEAHPEPAGATAMSCRVLVVDDDEMVLESLAALLAIRGHEVHTAEGGPEALRMLESGLDVDLVILDMNMPVMNGAEVIPKLRVLRPTVPVLLATGLLNEASLQLNGRFPELKLIGKPFDIKELEASMAGLFPPASLHAGAGPALQKILLVDDDEDVRFLTSRMLRKAGLAVRTAASGEEALRELQSQPLPDLVILDFTMPGMDGVMAMEKIQELHPGLPVMISSGRVDIREWSCFSRPHVGFLPKPFTPEELFAMYRLLA